MPKKSGLYAALAALAVTLFPIFTQADNSNAMQITNLHKNLASQTGWLNTSRALAAEDLQGRIILIDFWTFCCINCMHVIPDLKYLEEKFGHDLTVIGVHSAKFKNERDTENIRSAILRYGIEHAVVNDFDFKIWQSFGVRAWPTFMLINPKGTIEAVYSGEGNREEAEADIERLRQKYAGQFVTTPLPIALEKDKTAPSILSFPSKLDTNGKALFASDSAHHRIAKLTFSGEVELSIGSGVEGFKDGSFATAQFRRPQGVLYQDGKLYVADTENHALRLVDLANKTVTTLAGTGKQGYERDARNAPALSTPLASPWDLAFYPDNNHIAIAMAGTHQLWSYDIENKTVSVIAGNGRESIDDGRYPFNSLSQPSGLAVHDDKLYFVDSETSSLRVYDGKDITTLIGTGLFDFGYVEGKQGTAKMQHALGVYADDSGVYIADSYNHSIRRYDPKTGVLSNFAGHGVRGRDDGAKEKASFNEPNDLLKMEGLWYVADTNNNAIRTIDSAGNVATLKVNEASSSDAALSEQLPNIQTLPPATLTSSAVVTLGLQKGWHINEDAPSSITLFVVGGAPKTIVSFDTAAIRKGTITLPALSEKTPYHLQATLYYCEDKAGAQCLIKSFDVKVSKGGQKELKLPLN